MNNHIGTLNGQIDNLNNQIGTVNGQIDNLNGQIEIQNSQLENQNSQIENQNSQIQNQNSQLEIQNGQIAILTNSIANCDCSSGTSSDVQNQIDTHGLQLKEQKDELARQNEVIESLSINQTLQNDVIENLSHQEFEIPAIVGQRLETLEELSLLRLAPSCEHLATFGLTKSGFFNIDMDGEGNGLEPFRAFCNFTTNETIISHSYENPVEITKCSEPGCFKLELEYSTDMENLEKLIEISESCSQEITFDCHMVALEYNDVNLAWWTSRDGEKQLFSDEVEDGNNFCSCGW